MGSEMCIRDRLYNTRSILADVRESGESVFERFSGKRDGTLWYYAALVDAFLGFPNRMVGELDRMVGELDRTVGELRRQARDP